MKVGIPKGLLYCKYHPFINTFFNELDTEIVTSEETNKKILNEGVKYSVDEACLPIKIFHGHVSSIKDKCDILLIPRIMQLKKNEYICPKFCGLPEMIKSDIPQLPKCITYPIYAFSDSRFKAWIFKTGFLFTKNYFKIKKAYKKALCAQNDYQLFINNNDYKVKVAVIGHPYNVYDKFINMDLINKLNKLNIGVVTEENLSENFINNQITGLFKKPFWTFTKNSYSFARDTAENNRAQGIIYVSSFACGIDSITIELIKDRLKNIPFLVLKLDEQTGEAGFDTRIEAFIDMLERRDS